MEAISSYVANLREKPEHARRRAAFWWAFGVTFVIFLFWLASFDLVGKKVQTSAAAVASQVSSPGQSLVAGIGALGSDLWTTITGPKKVTFSEIEVLPGKN